MKVVLDASVALLWLAPETNPQGSEYSISVLNGNPDGDFIVPSLFMLELANVVSKLERKAITTEAQSRNFIRLIEELSPEIDDKTSDVALGATLELARRYGLSAYDASYMELALRSGSPLATLDDRLRTCAKSAGVHIYGHTSNN